MFDRFKIELNIRNVQILLLAGEFLISYSIESIKLCTGLPTGISLSFTISSISLFQETNAVLFFIGPFALVFGCLADSYTGKSTVCLLEVLTVFASSLCWFLSILHERSQLSFLHLSRSMMVLSYAVSAVRNMFLLEQFDIETQAKEVGRYIFYLVYIRIVMRFVCELLLETGLGHPLHMSTIAMLSGIAYFIILLFLKRKMKNETVLFKVWELCIKHLFNKVTQPLHKISIYRENIPGILKQENAKKPGQYRVMFESILVVHTYTPFSSFLKPVPEKETSSKPNSWGNPRKIIDFLFPFSNSTNNMTDKTDENKATIQYLDETSPLVIKLVDEQTNMFFKTLIYFIPGVFMSNAVAFLMFTTVNQADFSSRNRTHWWTDMDLQWYSTIFDIVLFPLHEFIIYPFVRKRNLSNLHIFLSGYLALTLVVMFSLVVQIQLEDGLHFMPEEHTSNLRIFNTLPHPCYISIAGFINNTKVEAFDYILQTGVYVVESAKLWVTITERINASEESRSYTVFLKERKSISAIITKNGLLQNGDYDPTLFPAGEINSSVSSFFVIQGLTSLKESPSLNFIERKTRKNTAFRIEGGIQHELNAGIYTLEIKQANKTSSVVNNIVMKGAVLYVIFLYYNESGVFTGKVFLLEGPVTLRYFYLILQVFLSNVAQVLSSVSYFTFMFEHSPSKLRGGIFTILSVTQLLGLSFLTYYTKMKHFFSYSRLITIYASIFVVIFILNMYLLFH